MNRPEPRRRPDDRLSAYLDDELGPEERAQLATELESSTELRAELRLVDDARRLVRELPMIDPPEAAFVARTTGRRVAPRAGVAVLAIAAAWLLLLGYGAGTTAFEVIPPVGSLAERHAAASEANCESATGDVPMDEMDAALPMVMPDDMSPCVVDDGEILQVVYTDRAPTPHRMSVFVQPGTLDMDSRRDGLEPAVMNDEHALYAVRGGRSVVVFQRGDAVVTMVVDEGVEMMDEMMDAIPDQRDDPSLVDRARGGARRFLDLVTPGF